MNWVRRILWIGALTTLLVGGWLFAAQNRDPVRVHYVVGEFAEVALWKALVAAFAAGAAVVGVFTLIAALRHGLVLRRTRKLVGGLEAEIHQLRNLPLAPDPEAPGDTRTTRSDAAPPRRLGRDA
jgi:uncharacterized integral membrane protein